MEEPKPSFKPEFLDAKPQYEGEAYDLDYILEGKTT